MRPLIIGNASDLHVEAVVGALAAAGGPEPLLVDAPLLREEGFCLTEASLRIGDISVTRSEPGRGWLRRYAPAQWGLGIESGSLAAAVHRAFLTLVGAIARMETLEWLTDIEAMLRAEDRLHQLTTAGAIGIAVPRTVVASTPADVVAHLGENFVVKPLSLGFFWTEAGARAVYTSELDAATASEIDFGGAPFVAQEKICAERHLRVVTVGSRAWIASLSAEDRPLDWREQEGAHREWAMDADEQVGQQAIALARTLRVGYSSQDWLVRGEDRLFIDLNPGGQWLFLPEAVACSVTEAIADFLLSEGP